MLTAYSFSLILFLNPVLRGPFQGHASRMHSIQMWCHRQKNQSTSLDRLSLYKMDALFWLMLIFAMWHYYCDPFALSGNKYLQKGCQAILARHFLGEIPDFRYYYYYYYLLYHRSP